MQHKKIIPEARRIHLRPILLNPKIKQDRMAIAMQDRIEIIDVKDIICLKAESNYTLLHLNDGSSLLTSITLKRFEAKLDGHLFTRIHNGYLVQNKFIKSYDQKRGKIRLINKMEIPVSRSRKEEVMEIFKTMMV